MKLIKDKSSIACFTAISLVCFSFANADSNINSYKIVDTGQNTYFDNIKAIDKPSESEPFYGQDAQYMGHQPSYTDNNDGTVTDNVTGLMWQQSFDHNGDGTIDVKDKLTYAEILKKVESGTVSFGKYDDWRLPTIKEAYSLMMHSGKDISPQSKTTADHTPFIDNKTFAFAYGDVDGGERVIDMQVATSNVYVSEEVPSTVFGVNFADGRIKGYGIDGLDMPSKQAKTFNYLFVRGNSQYGINNFVDNSDGTITDKATGLMWAQDDNKEAILWKDALAYAEAKEFAGHSDWRLPNSKELQSIVDYSRSPTTSNSPSIDPIFKSSTIKDEAGEEDYPWYWTSTTHISEYEDQSGVAAVYVAFGRSLGNLSADSSMPQPPGGDQAPPPTSENSQTTTSENESDAEPNWVDIHGAGSQRSDPKTGNPEDYANGEGPQGDAKRIYNYVRLVRDAK